MAEIKIFVFTVIILLLIGFSIWTIYYQTRLFKIKRQMDKQKEIVFSKWKEKNDLARTIPPVSGCYLFKNEKTGRIYIGQSKNLRRRFLQHLNGNGNPFLHRAYLGGAEISYRYLLLSDTDYKTLDGLERDLIKVYQAKKKGYNRTRGNYKKKSNVLEVEERSVNGLERKGHSTSMKRNKKRPVDGFYEVE